MMPVKSSRNLKRIGYCLAILFFVLAISPAAKADTLGQDQSFFISSKYDFQGRSSISATLRSISGHAYFYIEDNYWNSVSSDMQGQMMSQVNALALEFDNRIYPTETQFFGSTRSAGVNGDAKITILLGPLMENAGGYYDTANEYPKQQAPTSNEREMIYTNIAALNDSRKIDSFLAHEFQHLISFNQKDLLKGISDDTWLNELRSEYAVTLLGYNDTFAGSNLDRRLQSFLNNPADSLTEWKNLPADYGQIALFGEYIAEHWSPGVIAGTVKNSLIGIPSLEDALSQNGFKDSFKDVFSDWLTANIVNDVSVNPKFGYSRNGLQSFHVPPSRVLNNLSDDVAFVVSDSIKDWQGRWYDVSQFASGQNNFLRIKFQSASLTSFFVPYIVFKTGGGMSWAVFNPDYNSDTLYIEGIDKDISRVVFMPVKKDKISGFSANETLVPLTFSVDRVVSQPQVSVQSSQLTTSGGSTAISPTPTPIPNQLLFLPSGSLIRARDDYKVYVISGNWKRHILSSRIFSFYPQFGFDKVQEVDPSVLARYQESNLVRYDSSQRVYAVDDAGKKHWLNISAQQFLSSGRSADSIFPINLSEFNFYRTGTNITK